MSEFVSILERIRPGYKNGGKVARGCGAIMKDRAKVTKFA